MPSRPSIADAAVCLGAVGVVVSTFMPWLQSGKERRSSYELFTVVRRIQQVPTEAMRAATFWWPAVPLLVVASVVTALWGMRRIGAILGVLAAVYVGVFAIGFWRVDIPPLGGRQIGSTVFVAAASSAVFALAHLAELVTTRKAR